jgi:predicted ABC-type ATPase
MKRRKARARPKIIIIAGPNGAGKTTFAQEFLPNEAQCVEFINADLIARGLSPFAPEKAALQAGKIMLNQIAANVSAGRSFAFEATLAGLNYARHVPRWRKAGYYVKLVFLSLPSADLAVDRVAARVRQGGHGVPDPVIRRRFDAGLQNFHAVYKGLVNSWALYDSAGSAPRLLEEGENR